MASHNALTVLFGLSAVFWCLDLLELAAKIQTSQSQSRASRLAAAALLPAVVTTFALALLLLFTHVRALARANAAGGGFKLGRLATLAATAAALLAGALVRLVADDGNLGGAEDVGWVYAK